MKVEYFASERYIWDLTSFQAFFVGTVLYVRRKYHETGGNISQYSTCFRLPCLRAEAFFDELVRIFVNSMSFQNGLCSVQCWNRNNRTKFKLLLLNKIYCTITALWLDKTLDKLQRIYKEHVPLIFFALQVFNCTFDPWKLKDYNSHVLHVLLFGKWNHQKAIFARAGHTTRISEGSIKSEQLMYVVPKLDPRIWATVCSSSMPWKYILLWIW